MKIFSNFLALTLLVCALFMSSCSKENDSMLTLNEETQVLTKEAPVVDFETLILENIVEGKDGEFSVELSPKEFEQALSFTFSTPTVALETFFEDVDSRTTFRQNLQQVLLDNNIIEAQTETKSFCEHTYFAEAYANVQGYVSASSNSFAYARSQGTTNLWASSFSCVTFDEAYSGYYATCPYTNCNTCYARSYYYSGGGGAIIYGAGC